MTCALLALGTPAAAETPPPDPALLEFLADWDDGQGGLVDWEMLDAQGIPAAAPAAQPRAAQEADDATR